MRAANGALTRVSASALNTRAPMMVACRAPAWAVSRRGLCSGADMEVPIPELGAESIVEGGILSIAKSVGDYVAAEEMVAEIETGSCQTCRDRSKGRARLASLNSFLTCRLSFLHVRGVQTR